jgi:ABC-type amino acid transport substrate-binding protein
VRKIIARLTLSFAVSLLATSTSSQAQDRNDPRVQAGAAEAGISEDESTLRQQGVDALTRAKTLGKITACADPYGFPYSTSNGVPPGFDVELFQALAKRAGLRGEMYWSDTGTRGGLGRALRNSIDKGRCDIFMGLAVGIDEEELREHKLALTKGYMGLAYVLVVQGKLSDVKALPEIKERKVKIGVGMSTPADEWLFNNGYDFDPIFQSGRLIERMAQGGLDAGMLFSPNLGEAKKAFPKINWKVPEGYVPEKGLRWNAAWAVPKKDEAFKAFVEEGLDALLKSGEMQKIVEGYGMPFFPPFAN